jgi:hypothetical protein
MDTGKAIRHIEAAMRELSKASGALQAAPIRGRLVSSPDEYYRINRVWAEVDAILKTLVSQSDPRTSNERT